MEPLNDIRRRYTDSADEELGLILDDHGDDIVEQTFGVVVVGLSGSRSQ